MVGITISIDEATYKYLHEYMDTYGTKNMSQAARALIRKGIAHERAIAAKLAVEAQKTLDESGRK